jgi:hypothetical protein
MSWELGPSYLQCTLSVLVSVRGGSRTDAMNLARYEFPTLLSNVALPVGPLVSCLIARGSPSGARLIEATSAGASLIPSLCPRAVVAGYQRCRFFGRG